jgi:AcrR family transcriptional regulator
VTKTEAPPGTKQARGRARRQAIVEAAVSLFATHGFRGTSVAAVAEQAGVTDAGVLYHFGTKDELLLAVLAHHDHRYEEVLRATMAPGGLAALEGLKDWGVEMESQRDLQALYVLLSAEHMRDDSPTHCYFEERYARVLHLFTRLFAQAARRGELREDLDAPDEASALLALLEGLRLQWFFTDGQISIAAGIERYVELTLERLSLSRTQPGPGPGRSTRA